MSSSFEISTRPRGRICNKGDEGQYLYLPYNVAVAELALGDMKKGLELYSKTVTRPGMKNDGGLVAGAVGDLETLYHYCEGLNSKDYCKEIQSKEPAITLELAAAAWPAPETVKNLPGKAALRNVVLQVEPSGLRWQAQPVNIKLDDGTTALSVLWYTREPALRGEFSRRYQE